MKRKANNVAHELARMAEAWGGQKSGWKMTVMEIAGG